VARSNLPASSAIDSFTAGARLSETGTLCRGLKIAPDIDSFVPTRRAASPLLHWGRGPSDSCQVSALPVRLREPP
jgi:hypothetical protein